MGGDGYRQRVTTALYRRYRPETFDDVIGQDHVTGPLRQALRTGRITHAYLFSGPRGCGKTTSARILARCLNCAEGPTDTPCGVCDSCVELSRDGSGSLDVVEIDAASHNGVDDARDLRERAAFAPARDRFKIFILDEAHMVTPQGFNALLKIVEEPPPHVKFVFATTEPDKVIGTIRSRTHHYPFRLVPPEKIRGYLAQLCEAEEITVADGVLPLVVRAGGGSVRDSLSVLDQLIAGSPEGGIDYEMAVDLLGYTHETLLDAAIEGFAAQDGATVFNVVGQVIESGHDPRRFVDDLLERFRDLIVIDAVGNASAAVLRDLPTDQLDRMMTQARHFGPAQLSRAADIVNDALTEMSGATSPRLHLELLCARVLLQRGAEMPPASASAASAPLAVNVRPSRDDARSASAATSATSATVGSAGGVPSGGTANVNPIQGGDVSSSPARSAPAASRTASQAMAPESESKGKPSKSGDKSTRTDSSVVAATTASSDVAADSGESPNQSLRPVAGSEKPAVGPDETAHSDEAGDSEARPNPQPASAAASSHFTAQTDTATVLPADTSTTSPTDIVSASSTNTASASPAGVASVSSAAATSTATGEGDSGLLRRRWPDVMETLSRLRRVTWTLVSQNAQILTSDGEVVRLAFLTPQLANRFRTGQHSELVSQAIHETIGVHLRVEISDTAANHPDQSAPADSSAGFARQSGGFAPSGSYSDSPQENRGQTPVTSGPTGTHTQPESPRSSSSANRTAPEAGSAPRNRDTPGVSASGASAAVASAVGLADPVTSVDSPRGEEESQAGISSPQVRVLVQETESSPVSRVALATPVPTVAPRDDEVSFDDVDAENSGLMGAPLIAQMLGGVVIDEIPLDE